jgi:tetratricopeptide (TPR) repeat protein
VILRFINKIQLKALFYVLLFVITACDSQINDAESHLQKGKDLYEKGDYDSAILELKSSSQGDDQRSETYYYMALLDEKNNNFKAMRENLQKTIEIDPNNLDARKKLGKVNLLLGELDAVFQQADFILNSEPENEEAKLLKASVYLRQKKNDQAKEIVNEVLVKNPNSVDALSLKAAQAYEGNDIPKAMESIDLALKIDAKNLPLRIFKIRINAKSNDIESVIDGYKQLVEIYPDEVNFKISLASIYSMSDKLDLAENILREIVERNPERIEARIIYLEFLNAKAKDRVSTEFNKMLEELNGNPSGILELSKWMLVSGYGGDATRGLNKVIEKNKSDKNGLNARAILIEIDLNNKKYDDAESSIISLLEENSDFTEVSLLKARLLIFRNKVDEAIDLLNKVVWSNNNSDNAFMLLGQSYTFKNDQVQAVKNYKQALDINPANIQAFIPIFNSYLKANQKENAREILIKALNIKPNNVVLLNYKADLDIAEGKWEEAQEVVQKIALFSKDKDVPTYFQANIFQGKAQYSDAIKLYETLLKKIPNHLDSMVNLVRSYEAINQRDKAIVYLEKHYTIHKEEMNIVGVLSDLYMVNKDYSKAKQFLENQIKITPNRSVALYLALAKVEANLQKNPAAAIKIYQNAIIDNPDNEQLLNALASLYEQLGNKQDARKIYERILDKNPNLTLSINNLAALLLESEVIEDIQKALVLVEGFEKLDNSFLKDTYAWALIRNGKTKEGLVILESLILKEPKMPDLRYHLGVAHLNTGNKATALVELKQAMSLAEKQNRTFAGKEKCAQLIKELEHY